MSKLEQLKAERGRIGLDWQIVGEEIEALERELIPYFSARKAVRVQLQDEGFPSSRRGELFAELDDLQFACDHCDDPDHCEERLTLASNTEDCRSRGNLDLRLQRLRKRSAAYQREVGLLDKEIEAASSGTGTLL